MAMMPSLYILLRLRFSVVWADKLSIARAVAVGLFCSNTSPKNCLNVLVSLQKSITEQVDIIVPMSLSADHWHAYPGQVFVFNNEH